MELFKKLAIAQAVSAVAVGGASAALADEPAGPSLSFTAYDYDVDTDGMSSAKYPAVDLEDSHKAFAAELLWPLSGAWDVRLGYNLLESDNNEVIGDFVSAPGKYVGDVVGSHMAVDYEFLDFEAGYAVQLGGQDVRLFGGLRYAELDQDLDAGYNYGYIDITTIPATAVSVWGTPPVTRADHEFSALGLRFGAESAFTLSEECGLSVSGLLAGVALYGERDSSYYKEFASFAPKAVDKRSEEGWWYGLEAELALNWQVMPEAGMSPTVSLGYSFSRMEDILETRFDIDDVVQHRESDLTLQGPFLRLGWQF